jgi:hypothetical protein
MLHSSRFLWVPPSLAGGCGFVVDFPGPVGRFEAPSIGEPDPDDRFEHRAELGEERQAPPRLPPTSTPCRSGGTSLASSTPDEPKSKRVEPAGAAKVTILLTPVWGLDRFRFLVLIALDDAIVLLVREC